MKTIPVTKTAAGIAPSEAIPNTAVRVVCDGENYTVYEDGDELPPDPHAADAQPEGAA